MGQKIGYCHRCLSNNVPVSSVGVCDPCRIAGSINKGADTAPPKYSGIDAYGFGYYLIFFFQVLVHFFKDTLFPFEIGGFWRGCIMGIIYYYMVKALDNLRWQPFYIKLLIRFPLQLLCWGWIVAFWATLLFQL